MTPDALRLRRQGLLADLLRQAEGHEVVPSGLRLRFAPAADILATMARVVEAGVSAAGSFASGLPLNLMAVQSYWS